jgi:glucose-6-phosphate isomerase
MTGSRGRTLRFLANVDPIDVVGAGAAAAAAAWVAALWCCGVLFAAAGATLNSPWGVHVGGNCMWPCTLITVYQLPPPGAVCSERSEGCVFACASDTPAIACCVSCCWLQARALNGLDPEETMAVVISKTFTTAETMLNARTVRSWLTSQLGE